MHPTALRVARAALPTLLLSSVIAAGGCKERPAAAPPAAVDASVLDDNARLDELVRAHLDETTAASPTLATWLGLHGADDKLDDVSAAAQARETQYARRLLDRLGTLPSADPGDAGAALSLDERHQLDRALLARGARLSLFELTELRELERNPIRYVDVFSSGIYELLSRSFSPLPERLKDLDGRLSHARTLFDEARKNLKNPPELYTRHAIDLMTSTRGFIVEILPRVAGAPGDERLLAEFRTSQGEALRAIDDYLAFLQRDLLPRSTGELPMGKARFIEGLRLRELIHTPSEPLLAQLVSAGDRELREAQKRFEDSARQVAPGKNAAEVWRNLEDDHPGAAELLPSVDGILAEVMDFAQNRKLLSFEGKALRASEMPPYLWGFARVMLPGPFETGIKPELWVDPVNKAWDRKVADEHLRAFNRPQMVQVVVREALAHAALAARWGVAPSTMQKMTVDQAFTEGWPRYLAQTVMDEGLGDQPDSVVLGDPRLRLAQRREVLQVLCRFVAALRFHAQGERLEDVAQIFAEQGYLDEAAAKREAERVAIDPGVVDEGLGLLAFLKLRNDAESARGKSFDEGRFHDELLAHGPLPLALLRQRILPGSKGSLF